MGFPNYFDNGQRSRPPLTRKERRRAKLRRLRRQCDAAAWRESKHHAITTGLMEEFTHLWGDDLAINSEKLAADLTGEHRVFANSNSAAELEDNAPQTVVGIGEYKGRGRQKGFVLVYNEAKRGLGFPGGRVRFGQSPEARLVQEVAEEVNLACEVVGPPVSEHKVGEEEHLFSAYEVRFIGRKPMARPSKDEPITAVVFVDREILLNACRTGALIAVKGLPEPVGILASHRKVFLEYMTGKKEAVDV